jgi:predicted histone-like DNA-binding protein
MAAKYDFKTSPDVQGKEEQPTLYPQIVVSGTKDLKDLAKEIARRSTIKEGTIVGLFCDLETVIANYLADGYNVKLGELGTFSATLTCRKVTDKSEIRAASVHFDNVKFKPTRQFRKEVRAKGKLERAEYGFQTSSTMYSEKERLELLTEYLKEHLVITCQEYCTLTGLLKTKAGNELRRWSKEKKIERDGRAPHVMYRAMPEASSTLIRTGE